jgi:hypothetical protein
VMLTVLEFQLPAPTMMPFLDRFTKVNGCNDMHRQVVQYLAELSLLELRMIRYPPSHLAAATVFLSNKLLKQHPSWSQEMVALTEALFFATDKQPRATCLWLTQTAV